MNKDTALQIVQNLWDGRKDAGAEIATGRWVSLVDPDPWILWATVAPSTPHKVMCTDGAFLTLANNGDVNQAVTDALQRCNTLYTQWATAVDAITSATTQAEVDAAVADYRATT